MKKLRVICFTICIVCIVVAVPVSLSLIWGSASAGSLSRALASIAVLFLASLLTMGVARMVEPKLEHK